MKILLFIFFVTTAYAQVNLTFTPNNPFAQMQDCGTWSTGEPRFSQWRTVDSTHCTDPKDTDWVYGEWYSTDNGTTYAVYCPCGCGWAIERVHRRISYGGLVQEQTETIPQVYTPKPKTPFEKLYDSLIRKK